MHAMNIESLDESWQIVLVVTAENLGQWKESLEDLQAKSLHGRISILAADAPVVRDGLAGLPLPIAYLLPPTIKPGGYWATVVSAHEFSSERTIFIQAGTRVPVNWDARLVAAGQRTSAASAISPQCTRHEIFSVFGSAQHKPELSVDEIDQWLNDYVDGVEYAVPVMLESCALLQGSYWRDCTHPIVDDSQLFEELRAQGAWLLATDQLYVDDFNTFYSVDAAYLPKAYLDACLQRAPLARVHHALAELSRRREPPPALRDCLPVQLHVGHSWGGGLERWMADFIAADTAHNHLVLRSIGDLSGFGQTIALYRSTEMDVPIRTWTLSQPVLSISVSNFEYPAIIEELVSRYNVESIVISSLVGHTLDLLRTDLPTAVVLHDFFPFCPALYATFGAPCTTCSSSALRNCSRENPRNSYFNFEVTEHWMAIRMQFLQLLARNSITVFAPSQSVVDRYRQLEIRLSDKPIHVVAHGLGEQMVENLRSVQEISTSSIQSGKRLTVVMLGRLTEEKGGELLGHIFGQISSFAEVHLLGTGESGVQFGNLPGVSIRESYNPNELAILLRDIKPDIGMLLSTVPETFSYTLSELWAAGIPVLATRIGAFIDRICDGENGWLVEPEQSAVVEKLRHLDLNKALLANVKRKIAQQSVRTASQMVNDYAKALPTPADIPLVRYNLPRRSYRNPYLQDLPGSGSEAFHVNPQRSYRQVLAGFLQYTSRRAAQSPKLPHWISRILGRTLYRTARYLDRQQPSSR